MDEQTALLVEQVRESFKKDPRLAQAVLDGLGAAYLLDADTFDDNIPGVVGC
jgi:hypothetical protein